MRVRILPGTGNFTLNGRRLEAYFPSKVHQQVVARAAVPSERLDTLDVIANLRGGGVTGQAGALRLAIARALMRAGPRRPPGAEEGRLPHPRRPR